MTLSHCDYPTIEAVSTVIGCYQKTLPNLCNLLLCNGLLTCDPPERVLSRLSLKEGVRAKGLGERRGVRPTCPIVPDTSGSRRDARQFDPALRLDRGHRPDKMSDSFQAIPMFGVAGIFSKLFVFGQLRPKTGRRLTAIHDSERRCLWLLRHHVPSAAHRSNVRE
jgi:hypothetical protein